MDSIDKIRRLNDNLRKHFLGGEVMITSGVSALSKELRIQLFEKIKNFNNFTKSNDPYEEHDFGKVELEGEIFFWKIDYYDNSRRFYSPDPSNPKKTTRVLTIMLSEEY